MGDTKNPKVAVVFALLVVGAVFATACGTGTHLALADEPDIDPPKTTTSIEFDWPVEDPRPPLVDIVEGEFVHRETGERFVPRGVNYFLIKDGPSGMRDRFFSPLFYNGLDVLDDFQELSDLGYNTVRLFMDSCPVGDDCIAQDNVPGLDPEYLSKIVAAMWAAEHTGLMLILTSNDLPVGGGYQEIANRDNSDVFPGYRNSIFLTASGHEAMRAYWTDLLTGLVNQGAPFEVVLGWSILNEHWLFSEEPPLGLESGLVTTASGTYDMADPVDKRAMVVDSTRLMIDGVAGVIRSILPEANVTMGFFVPQFPNPTTIGDTRYVDTAPLVASSDLDFFDFHFYTSLDITVAQAAQNFGITDAKPVVMGEYGTFLSSGVRPESVGWVQQTHVAESCDAGWDGWVHWGYLRSPLGDPTWALTDIGGELLHTLAPISDPDPCDAPENPNLAARAGATITASSTEPGSDPSRVADGTDAHWSAGAHAPQSITIDLGAPAAMAAIELVVDQYPAGRTVHRLQWAVTEGDFNTGIVFDGVTESGDVLRAAWGFERPTMRYIRVTTTTSPSWVAWREINVYGVFVP